VDAACGTGVTGGVPAGKMSVGGITLVSVISPGMPMRAPGEWDDAPLARRALALAEPVDKGELADAGLARPTGLSGRAGVAGRGGLNGRAGVVAGRGELGEAELGEAELGEAELGEAELGEAELGRLEFAVVDLETTGWSPAAAAITEIGAVRVKGNGDAGGGRRGWELTRQGEFASLVNTGMPVPPGIADLTGITDWMLAAAPRLGAVLPALLDFASGCVLVAHNAPFDLGFLVAGCGDCGLAWPGFTVLDTVMLARRVMDPDEVPDCKLGTLAGFFGARTAPNHRALADARATADVLGWLIRRLAHRGIRTLNQLSAWPDVVA
jgi:DNA polymerase III epsilon subunit-like protein